eukprot:c28417_g1_i4 orf=338-664(+)
MKKKNQLIFLLLLSDWFLLIYCLSHQMARKITVAEPKHDQKQTIQCGIGSGYKPFPNFTHIKTSTMQLARESQQNAPSFFVRFLWNRIQMEDYRSGNSKASVEHVLGM